MCHGLQGPSTPEKRIDPYTPGMTEWPDLGVLELLVQLEERGSVGAAARHLGMAQPNASRAISNLEVRLGLPLVRRTPRGSDLTSEGAMVVEWSRGTLTAARQLLEGVEALKGENSSQISIGASMTVAEYLIPPWLGQFRRVHPDVKVSFAVHNSQDVFEGVRQGKFDIGFVESPEQAARLKETLVGHDRMTVVVDPKHPWTRRRKPLSVEELAATPLVVREKGSGTRVTLDDFLEPYDPVAPAVELNSNSAVKISVQAGMGPAVLSYLAVQSALRSEELVAVPVTGMNLIRNLRAVWGGSRRLTGLKASLVEIATANVESMS